MGVVNGVEEVYKKSGSDDLYMRAVYVGNKFATFTTDGQLVLIDTPPTGYSQQARAVAGYGTEVAIEAHVEVESLTKEQITAAARVS